MNNVAKNSFYVKVISKNQLLCNCLGKYLSSILTIQNTQAYTTR